MLNCLYGIFGRKQEILETININNNDFEKYPLTYVIKTIIPIDDNNTTLLVIKILNSQISSEINSTLNTEITNKIDSPIKSKVATF